MLIDITTSWHLKNGRLYSMIQGLLSAIYDHFFLILYVHVRNCIIAGKKEDFQGKMGRRSIVPGCIYEIERIEYP